MPTIVCTPKSLTPAQSENFIRRSLAINPANAAGYSTLRRTPIGRRGGPRRLALDVGKRWPATGVRLTVQFLDNPSNDLRSRILLHMNAWGKSANVSFEETRGIGKVRIARLDNPVDMAGYWSYVGTEILGIDDDQPTMNLQGFTGRTSEKEFRRVVRHEAGHTLGFEHEHMRVALVKKIDRRKAIAYFDRTQGWTAEETVQQVLTPLAKRSIMGTTESDPLSIMCYQIPGTITKDGKAIPGGRDINQKDFVFAGTVYPKKPKDRQTAAVAGPPPEGERVSDTILSGEELHLVIMDDFDATRGADWSTVSKISGSKINSRPRFAQIFASYAGARVTGRLRLNASKDEKPTRFGDIIRMHERIKNYTNRERGSLPSDKQMVAFGKDLFETLFQGDVRRLYDEARTRQQTRKLDFILTSMIPWIAEKPWEFAYDTTRNSFLATEEVHFVRNVLTPIPADVIPPLRGPLRILVVAAQPVGFGHLSVQQEVEVIRRGFEPLIDAGFVKVEVVARSTPSQIHGLLSLQTFNVVHFIGHGTHDEKTEEGALIFEDGQGGLFPLAQRSVREIFCQRGVSLVYLNACQTGTGGRAEFNKGLAQSLVAHGLPGVIANQYSVLDSSATSFAQHFYWAIAQGMSIGEAAREARIAVNYSMQGELIDWAVPVVYARDPNLALCERPQKITPAPVPGVRRAIRRATQGHIIRVAVWDIDNVFPGLEKTLEVMNGTQSMFGFELVTLSIPIDTWDVENRAEDGTPYLWAEKLANRLKQVTVSLGVSLLACVTRHWMRDNNDLNLYGWWPDGKKPPVVIFSCAGFDELPAEGVETDRVISNMIVAALAGYLADMDSHKRGAKDCPMWFNQSRDYAHLMGFQKFDPRCRTKLKKVIPKELPALEVLLRAFQSKSRIKKER
ncbi:MAG: CHAT domain-containing protein [Nitrospirales bacterium]